MSSPLDWERDGADWPLRGASRFIAAGGLRWHVQVMGQGPVLLLLHGTGASTHSWREVAPLLATQFTVVAPDLPGHAFSEPLPTAPTLPAMAAAVTSLLRALHLAPQLAVGHSAGAAIVLRATLDQAIAPRGVVSVNGALLPFSGIAGLLFAPTARLLFGNSIVARLFAARASDEAALRRLVGSTGSALDRAGTALYGRLIARAAHVQGALAMMAHWDLAPLAAALPRLATPTMLLMAGNDRTLPADEGRRQRALLPAAEYVELPGLGHLAHEEQPVQVAAIIASFARRCGALSAPAHDLAGNPAHDQAGA